MRWYRLLLAICAASVAQAARPPDDIDRAFTRLYNFDFTGAQAILNQHISSHPGDSLGYAVRASGFVFQELDRLGVLESEFFSSDKRIIDKKKLQPDPAIRTKVFDAVSATEQRAQAVLGKEPMHPDSLFALCISQGIVSDYVALIDKRQMASLAYSKRAVVYAQDLLKAQPSFIDAYLSTGLTQYILGNLPFFLRWFVKVEDISGDKTAGIRNLERVASDGRYLKPFAKILLSLAWLREKKPTKTQFYLRELHNEFPENQLFRRELEKVTQQLSSGQISDR